MELHNRIVELMLQKGIYSKPPRINTPKQVDFVHDSSYLTGWFGDKRPLNAIEISGLSYNMQKTVGKTRNRIWPSMLVKRAPKILSEGESNLQKTI